MAIHFAIEFSIEFNGGVLHKFGKPMAILSRVIFVIEPNMYLLQKYINSLDVIHTLKDFIKINII